MRLADSDLRALLPAHIADDPAFSAAGQAVAPHLRALARAIPNLLVFARLGHQAPQTMLAPLARLTAAAGGLKEPELELLELLAWQFHVDFREAARSKEALAGMVLSSIPWHRIKGTPASIRAALSLCGYSGIELEENNGGGPFWAAYQLGLSDVTGMDDLARIVAICREMQPARCRLWRVYTPDYDFRPGVWSGPLPVCTWAKCWWSEYSGAEAPDIPGLDDATGLIVSFGARRATLVSPLCGSHCHAGRLLTLSHGWQAPLLSFPEWSECHWGDLFPPSHSFTFAHLYSFTWAEALYEPYHWTGRWDERIWRGRLLRVDRRLPPWRFHVLGHPLTDAVWSGLEPAYSASFAPDAAHGRILPDNPGAWSALNGFWSGAPRLQTLPDPQCWSGSGWSADALAPQTVELLELVPCLRGEAVPALKPRASLPAISLRCSSPTAPLCPDAAPRWQGQWDTRRWRGHCGFFVIKSETTQRARKKRASKKREDS